MSLTTCCKVAANFRTVFSESQNANPFDSELEPEFKIVIYDNTLHLTPPLQKTPANIHINLTLIESRIPWLQYYYVADSIYVPVALRIFEQFCPKRRNPNSIVAETERDFNAKWSFKVIQGHLLRRD